MPRLLFKAVMSVGVLGLGSLAQAQGDSRAVIEKAVEAVGGAATLARAEGASWTTKGTMSFGGNESDIKLSATSRGIDCIRSTFEGDFGGNTIMAVTVCDGKQGWRSFNGMTMELDDDMLDNQKRALYLQLIPVFPNHLTDARFKTELLPDEKVAGKAARVLKVTGPDKKDFKLYLDSDSGLPVRTVATVQGFQGEEFTQETDFADYKDLGGIKKATKITAKRDGEPFLTQEVSEFKTLEKVDPATFKAPE